MRRALARPGRQADRGFGGRGVCTGLGHAFGVWGLKSTSETYFIFWSANSAGMVTVSSEKACRLGKAEHATKVIRRGRSITRPSILSNYCSIWLASCPKRGSSLPTVTSSYSALITAEALRCLGSPVIASERSHSDQRVSPGSSGWSFGEPGASSFQTRGSNELFVR